jgi:cytochrome P450
MVLDGHHLPPGTRVGISTWTAHHDPSIWGDDVEGWSGGVITAEQKVVVVVILRGLHVTPR